MSEWEEFLHQPVKISKHIQILYKHAVRCLWCGEIIWKPNEYTDNEMAICGEACYYQILESKKALHDLVFKELVIKNRKLYKKLEESD